MANLSEQNRSEQQVFGLTDDQLVARLTSLMDRGHSETLMLDGRPAYASGVADGYLWFIATQAWFELGIAGIRIARKRVAMVRRAEGKPMISLSRSTHPGAPRWFTLLGFVENREHNVDGERMFVYP